MEVFNINIRNERRVRHTLKLSQNSRSYDHMVVNFSPSGTSVTLVFGTKFRSVDHRETPLTREKHRKMQIFDLPELPTSLQQMMVTVQSPPGCTASAPTSNHSMWHYNCLWSLKG